MEEKQTTFQLEQALAEIENIINKLESDDIALKESLTLYDKGAKLIAECKKELTGIEKEMITIGKETGIGE